MVTLIKYGALSGGEKYNVNVLSLDGLSTDTKPIRTYIEYGSDGREVGRMGIPNGSLYTEIDTGDTYMYDADNTTWHKVSIGGGAKPEGGIILVGETTTALTDGATTNPIVVDGQSYTAQPNDAVLYGNKEFLFTGARWREFGDLSGLASKDIGAMTGYAKAQTGSAIATTDTLNQAIGKVEKRVDVNENNISLIKHAANTSIYIQETTPTTPASGDYWLSAENGVKVYGRTNNLLNYDTATLGYYINASGEPTESSGTTAAGKLNYSDFIPVTAENYTLSGKKPGGLNTTIAFCWYDANKTFLDRTTQQITSETENYTFTASPISNAAYMIVNFMTVDQKVMVNEGTTALSYQPYYDWI